MASLWAHIQELKGGESMGANFVYIKLFKINIILLLSFLLVFPNNGNTKNIIYNSPFTPLDENGKQINAHAGDIIKYNNIYYWYGEDKNAGSRSKTGVHVYASKDLEHWSDQGLALKVSDSPNSDITSGVIIERPKVLYNKKNNNFIMMFHLEKKGMGYSSALVGLAKSRKPEGPFIYIKSFRLNKDALPLNHFSLNELKNAKNFLRDYKAGQMSRDMTLFKDSDDSAYLISSSEGNSTLIITKLNKDYDGLTGDFVRVAPGDNNEAPVVIKKNNKYFIISSGSTGWEPNKARLYVSSAMLGDWTDAGTPIKSNNAYNREHTFGGQGSFAFNANNKTIFVLDVWNKNDLGSSKYLFIPLKWDSNKLPYLSTK